MQLDPTTIATAIVFAIVVVALLRAVRRHATVCEIDVQRGKAALVRGQIAPRLLADIGDVVRRPKVVHGTIRVMRDRGRARVTLGGGFTEAQAQQIRNVVGSVPLARFGSGGRKR
ncbi:hypothetical protein BH09MYX1_BH09MYX1_26290 [soil metagenome]